MAKPRMYIERWCGGWRWFGAFGARGDYDLGWVETMTPREAWRELRGMMREEG